MLSHQLNTCYTEPMFLARTPKPTHFVCQYRLNVYILTEVRTPFMLWLIAHNQQPNNPTSIVYTDGIHCWTSIYWFTSSHITRATTANDFCNHRVDKRTLNHQPWQIALSKPNTSSLIIVFSILPTPKIWFLQKIHLRWNKQKNFSVVERSDGSDER